MPAHLFSLEKGTQISVFLDDRPGTLAQVCQLLGTQNINIHALTMAEGIDHGYLRIVVDQPADALPLLDQHDYLCFSKDVLLLEIGNQPGCLGALIQTWADQGINVEYTYCAGGPRVDRGLIVIRVDAPDKALELLSDQVVNGLSHARHEDG